MLHFKCKVPPFQEHTNKSTSYRCCQLINSKIFTAHQFTFVLMMTVILHEIVRIDLVIHTVIQIIYKIPLINTIPFIIQSTNIYHKYCLIELMYT